MDAGALSAASHHAALMLGTNAAMERASAALRDVPMRVVDAGDTVIVCSYGHHDRAAYEQEARSRSAIVAAASEIAVVHTHGRISDDARSVGALLAGVPDDDVTPDTFPLTMLLGSPRAPARPQQQLPLHESYPPAPWWAVPPPARLEHLLAEWVETVYVPNKRAEGELRGGSLVGWDVGLVPFWRLGLRASPYGALTAHLSGTLTYVVGRDEVQQWEASSQSYTRPFPGGSGHAFVDVAAAGTATLSLLVDPWFDDLIRTSILADLQ